MGVDIASVRLAEIEGDLASSRHGHRGEVGYILQSRDAKYLSGGNTFEGGPERLAVATEGDFSFGDVDVAADDIAYE
jgi:hypothetical protein